MKLQWDHIIHYIHDLSSFQFPEDLLQLHEGGRHEALGTYNDLSYTDLSYIEFIDVFDQNILKQAAASEEQRLSFAATLERTDYTEGWKRLCFRTDNIEALNDHFISCGLSTIGPSKMSRTKSDGTVVSWQLLYIDDDRQDRELPFFIQWGDDDVKRTEQLESMFQSVNITDIALMTQNKDQFIQNWIDWFNADYKDGQLLIPDGPTFTLFEGDQESIESITLSGIEHPSMEIRGATYHFHA
ncbi:VOC family protein [Macrococcus hajekii]|uniref:VOC family protein n=1 Tax=Macrococcus hajekii TaxID=198482 RepID=A0A4R6BJI4_9STAP|nr:VOC family protein [Macrococcus hajekii]TDM01865.1 VOC family protein [Macrococcus hajekii]GGB08151.1 sulfurtransferase [Macrococcus hajekii]